MLESIRIQGFRGLRKLEVHPLSRFNLIVGPGGSGKTSILEAAFLLAAPTDPGYLLMVANQRLVRGPATDPASFMEDLLSILPKGGSGEVVLEGSFSGEQKRSRRYQRIPEDAHVIDPEQSSERRVSSSSPVLVVITDDSKGRRESHLFQEDGKLVFRPVFTDAVMNIRIDGVAAHLGASPGLAALWTKVQEEGQDRVVLEHLKRLRPSLRSIRVAAFGNRPTLRCDDELVGAIGPEYFGDGFMKALSLACNVVEAKGGALMIDEIDVSLHPGALRTVLKFLFDFARTLDVQIFATTHHLDVIDEALAMSNDGELRVLRLSPRRDGTAPEVENLSAEEARYRREELGIDLRWTA